MKQTFSILLAGLLLTGFTACEGSDENNDTPNNGEIQAPYTLSVDKSEIEADGKDQATFTLKDANGISLTDNEQFNYIVFENVETGNQLDKKTKVFTAVKNGTYTFKALYKNKPSENTVTITVKNRSKYEKYFRKIAAFDITNIFCGNCPTMAAALENVVDTWKQHMTVFAIHGPYNQKDPYIIGNVANSLLAKFVGSAPYPTCIFNLDYTMIGAGDAKPGFIAGIIEDQLRDYPATCGLRITSTYADGKINVEANLTSSADGTYDVGCALLKDKEMYSGTEYNDIVRAISGNYMAMSADKVTATAGQEYSQTFSFDATISAEDQADHRIVIFALRSVDGKTIIDNVAECKLGENTNYVLNE